MVEIDKICFIDNKIRHYGKVTTKEVMNEFEISMRTVRNYIDYLKEFIGAPIIYSHEKKGYVYESPFEFFIYMDEKLLMTYSFLRGIIKSFNYIPFVSKEIEDGFKKFISRGNLDISNKIEYELSQFEKTNEQCMRSVFESFRSSHKITITYTNQEDKTKEFTIEPIKLVNYQGNWFLIAHLSYLATPTIFNFSRISHIELTEIQFENKISGDYLKEYLDNNFGIFKNSYSGGDSKNVTIRFYNTAKVITRNQIFHVKQIIESGTHPDKGEYIQFTIPVKHYDEILGKVLQFGSDGEIVSPPDFKELWIEKIKKMYHEFAEMKS